jgi:hypothetical protein
VLAFRRGEAVITGLSGEFKIEGGDSTIVYASPEDTAGIAVFLRRQKNKKLNFIFQKSPIQLLLTRFSFHPYQYPALLRLLRPITDCTDIYRENSI